MAVIQKPAVSFAEAQELVDSVRWFHSFEMVEGLITPGQTPIDPDAYLKDIHLGDLTGKRVLEIGSWDGPLTYALKRRGADIVALDIQNPAATGFNVMKAVSGWDIPYVQAGVYDLPDLFGAEFDLVFFLGVFYHLKSPVMAFDAISRVMKPGASLYADGEGVGRTIQHLDGSSMTPADEAEALAALATLDRLGVPLALNYPGTYLNGDNWFLPNAKALEGWVIGAGLEPKSVWHREDGRCGCHAIKADAPRIEHPVW